MDDFWRFRDKLFVSSLTAYSDACTMPKLTPGCPYYRVDQGIATCGEECRDFLKAMGVDRPTRTLNVLDGLLMTGVSRPIEVASAGTPFDATETMLRELRVPCSAASTTTLLLRLRKLASTPPDLRDVPADEFESLRDELEQRGVAVDGVLRMGVAPLMALNVLRLLEIPNQHGIHKPWRQVYEACRTSLGMSEDLYQKWFVAHVTEWFARLVKSDRDGFLKWTAPPEALLVNLPPLSLEPEAQWIWDRFTVTRLDDWTTSSLVIEWDHSRGSVIGSCNERVLAARTVDPDTVAVAALSRLAKRTLKRSPEARDLSAEHFVNKAVGLLEAGNAPAAADIFTALAFVNPTDGDALNNLGFCLAAVAVEQATGPLNRAAALPMSNPAVNVANRAFVHHLLGQDSDALALLGVRDIGDQSAYVWVEKQCGSFQLGRMPLDAYVAGLRSHITDQQQERSK